MQTEISALSLRGLVRGYSGLPVLCNVSLEVQRGQIFALTGVNGAGKTTLIKCALDLCSPDHGEIRIFGLDSRLPSARARVGYLPERFTPPHYMTGIEFLRFVLSMSGIVCTAQELKGQVAKLGLDCSALQRPVGQYSKGMNQKLGLASCLLGKKDLYILDEPMSGLDPVSRVSVKAAISRLRDDGCTVFFTSHVLSDVEELCDSLAVISGGELAFCGAPAELLGRFGGRNIESAFMQCLNAA